MVRLSSAYFLVILIAQVYGAKILGVFFVPSISHQIVFQPIYKELSLRGHEVTVITTNPLKDPSLTNLTEIDVSFLYKYNSFLADKMGSHVSETKRLVLASEWFELLMINVFENEDFKRIYSNPKQKFDLIMVEALSPILYGFAGKFKAPLIGMLSVDGWLSNHNSVGNPTHPALYADMILSYSDDLTIYQKTYYSYYFLFNKVYHQLQFLPRADAIVKKYLGNDLPYIGDLEKNISMLFLNVNPIMTPIRPTVPCVIPLGFMHIKPVEPLPLDLQKILDNAKEGVIYFSLGSNVKSANLPANIKDVIIKSLSSLPYTVLWKWESEHVPGVSKNVITRKWFPQQDVLAHPNIKAFVTQGGLQSIEEAISRGIPMIGMPFIGDQPMNVKKMVKREMAIEVDPSTATVEQLTNAIIEVAENLKYKRKMKEIRDIVNDQPMTGLERAVWWAEYVIRHKGAAHLRSPTADIPLYQYLLLDVIGTVVAILVVAIYLFVKIIKISLHVVRPKVNKQKLS